MVEDKVMRVQQISVFLENRAGRLAELLRRLGQADVNIRALSLVDTADFGVLRLIVSDLDKGVRALRAAGLTVSLTDVLVVEVPDAPGGLAGVLKVLGEAGINVEYLYTFVIRTKDQAFVAMHVANIDGATAILRRAGIHALGPEDVCAI